MDFAAIVKAPARRARKPVNLSGVILAVVRSDGEPGNIDVIMGDRTNEQPGARTDNVSPIVRGA